MSVAERPFNPSLEFNRAPTSAEHLQHALANMAVALEFLKISEAPNDHSRMSLAAIQIRNLLGTVELPSESEQPQRVLGMPAPSESSDAYTTKSNIFDAFQQPTEVTVAEQLDLVPTVTVAEDPMTEQPVDSPTETEPTLSPAPDAEPVKITQIDSPSSKGTKPTLQDHLHTAVQEMLAGDRPRFMEGSRVNLRTLVSSLGLTRDQFFKIITSQPTDRYADGFEALENRAPGFMVKAPDVVVPPHSDQEFHLQKAQMRLMHLLHLTAPFGYVSYDDMAWLFSLKKSAIQANLSVLKRLPVYDAVVPIKNGNTNIGMRGKTKADTQQAQPQMHEQDQPTQALAEEPTTTSDDKAQAPKPTKPERPAKPEEGTSRNANREYLGTDGTWDTRRLRRFLGDPDASFVKLAEFLGSQLVHHNSTPDKDGEVIQILPLSDRNSISLTGSRIDLTSAEMRVLNLLLLSPDSSIELHRAIASGLFGEKADFANIREVVLNFIAKIHSVTAEPIMALEPDGDRYWISSKQPLRTREPSFGRHYKSLKSTGDPGFLEITQ